MKDLTTSPNLDPKPILYIGLSGHMYFTMFWFFGNSKCQGTILEPRGCDTWRL